MTQTETRPQTQTGLKIGDAISSLLRDGMPVRFKAYDGSVAGPPDADITLELHNQRGLSYLLTAPGAKSCTNAEAAFGESTSRVVVAVAPDQVAAVLGAASAAGVPAAVIGQAGGTECIAEGAFTVPVETALRTWRDAIPNLMAGTAGEAS